MSSTRCMRLDKSLGVGRAGGFTSLLSSFSLCMRPDMCCFTERDRAYSNKALTQLECMFHLARKYRKLDKVLFERFFAEYNALEVETVEELDKLFVGWLSE